MDTGFPPYLEEGDEREEKVALCKENFRLHLSWKEGVREGGRERWEMVMEMQNTDIPGVYVSILEPNTQDETISTTPCVFL